MPEWEECDPMFPSLRSRKRSYREDAHLIWYQRSNTSNRIDVYNLEPMSSDDIASRNVLCRASEATPRALSINDILFSGQVPCFKHDRYRNAPKGPENASTTQFDGPTYGGVGSCP
jgi:hypothetical protein